MAVLEVENIRKSFGKHEVLKGISFRLEKGQVLSIIGSSGSGKTTLLRCLNFLETADAGRIWVAGQEIFNAGHNKALSDREVRMNRLHFGLVFQDFNLFPQYTVERNVMLAPMLVDGKDEKTARQEARAIIDRVGLGDKLNQYPCTLSGGQKQRVAIARALAMDPDILCFDEPTSALDPELTGEVLNVIRGLKNGDSTMIVVTHEMGFAREVSDEIIFMADGVIEEQGTPDMLFNTPQSPKLRAFLRKSFENVAAVE